jgi:hypothetical protein
MSQAREELIGIVTTYLRAAEAGDLEGASVHLVEGVELLFPGGIRYRDLDDQYSSPHRRYRGITKTLDRFDVDEAESVVAVHGTLQGENLHGVHFQGVRFIDRFEFLDRRIAKQAVWNDLAATGVLEATTPDQLRSEFRVS